MRQINAAGLALLKNFEGLRLTAYRDPVGILTIGYGSTGPHVTEGLTITEAEAEALLRDDLSRFEAGVDKLAPSANENQFSAMVSLAFNIGLAGFERSTVLKRHRLGNHLGASRAFALWNKAGGRILPGLVRRREAEAKLYLKPVEARVAPVAAPRIDGATPVAKEPVVAPLGCLAGLLGLFR